MRGMDPAAQLRLAPSEILLAQSKQPDRCGGAVELCGLIRRASYSGRRGMERRTVQ